MSVRQEVLQLLADAVGPMTSAAIFQKCEEASGQPIVSQTLSVLKAEKLVDHAGMSDGAAGERVLVLWDITTAGRKELEQLAAENAAGGGDHKAAVRRHSSAARAGKRATGAHPKKRKHTVRKVQRRNATSRAREPHPKGITGWVLTAEGAFVLLGRAPAIQVKAESARSIVALIRAGADLDGLVEFIKKLDKGQA